MKWPPVTRPKATRARRALGRGDGDGRSRLHERHHLDRECVSRPHARALSQRIGGPARRGNQHAAVRSRSGGRRDAHHQVGAPDHCHAGHSAPRRRSDSSRNVRGRPVPCFSTCPPMCWARKSMKTSVAIPDNVLLDPSSVPAPQSRAIEEAIRLLASAARPVIMVGVGAYMSGAASKSCARSLRPRAFPFFRIFRRTGYCRAIIRFTAARFTRWPTCRRRISGPDVVLAVGVRFGLFTLGMSDLVVPHAAKIIHVEIDPKEIGRLRQVAVGIVADPRETLHAMNAQAKSQQWPDHKRLAADGSQREGRSAASARRPISTARRRRFIRSRRCRRSSTTSPRIRS